MSPPTETVAEVEQALDQVHAGRCAIDAGFLSLVGDYAATEAYRENGARDVAEWLAARFAMSARTAREYARVADALRSFPRIAAVYGEGRLSWDQLRALTRYATPETDAVLAAEGPSLSLRSIETRARRARRKAAEEAQRDHDERWLTMFWRRGRLILRGELPGDSGTRVEKALLRALERQGRPAEGEPVVPFDVRLADALDEICSGAIGADPDPDRATVVVHTEAAALRADDGIAELEGLMISSETARRLACDCRLQEVLEIGGIPVGIGSTSRVVPPRLLRELRRRDQGCRFPGCSRERWVHAHHVWHWAKGGPTDLGNLVLMCSYHHHFVHEGRWAIRGNPMGELEFVRPDGRVLGGRAPPRERAAA